MYNRGERLPGSQWEQTKPVNACRDNEDIVTGVLSGECLGSFLLWKKTLHADKAGNKAKFTYFGSPLLQQKPEQLGGSSLLTTILGEKKITMTANNQSEGGNHAHQKAGWKNQQNKSIRKAEWAVSFSHDKLTSQMVESLLSYCSLDETGLREQVGFWDWHFPLAKGSFGGAACTLHSLKEMFPSFLLSL